MVLRRRLRCFYCGNYSRNDQPGIPRAWACPHCQAMNHLNQRGDIIDPPSEAIATAPRVHFARQSPPAPTMAPATQPTFCDTCQRNQEIVNRAMAEYIPDEDDPEYNHYVATADAYRAELENRYPQVCNNCIGRVRDEVRAAGYTAKTDHLRRTLEDSRKRLMTLSTPRQIWTLRIIFMAKLGYIFSVLVGLVWHAMGIFAAPGSGQPTVQWDVCMRQLFEVHQVDATCFKSSAVLNIVKCALVIDFLTLWWNPKLSQKTNRPGERMRGLTSLWASRIFVLGLRIKNFLDWQEIPDEKDTLKYFHRTHAVMLAFLLLSAWISWKTVRIERPSASTFSQPIDRYLPTAPAGQTSLSEQQYQPVRPQASTFDTMAQSFTSAFGDETQVDDYVDYPPSPTPTVTSISKDSDVYTPVARRYTRKSQDDSMDWTPTRQPFGNQPVQVQPDPWAKAPQQPPPKSTEPHSIFAKPDPNPFRHKVPAFPKNATRQKLDPWKPGLWAPALPENKKSFFSNMMKEGGSPESRERLREEGVPKNVKRQAELFQEPQFKYDFYGYTGDKTTGLEDGFNDLFSK